MKISRRYKAFLALFGFAILMRLFPFFLEYVAGVKTSPQVIQNSPESSWLSIAMLAKLYPWNFSPMYGLLLLAGATSRKKKHLLSIALLFPFLFQLAGDVGIGLITGHWEWAFYPSLPFVYLSLSLFIIMGLSLRQNRELTSVFSGGFMAACGFFILSNFGVWALGGGTIYPLTPYGLVNCYAAAIPFFGNTILAVCVYIPLLFNPWVLRFIEEEKTLVPDTIAVATA
ncbi:hypothetical protein MNBD_PLANCTO02-3222 [hydrothermal vent metagenome]|uniref:Uncharacterized protein n=1 Tax=hydrothermal vent metagenome TaxID=652676 RepID=A0A3B1DQK9_9ZZZZ